MARFGPHKRQFKLNPCAETFYMQNFTYVPSYGLVPGLPTKVVFHKSTSQLGGPL